MFHNHCLLENLDWIPSHDNGRLVVVGSGQSAAEVAAHLHDVYPDSEIHVLRKFGFTPSDDTPYANRIFDPTAVDEFYHAPESTKRRLLDYHWLTNYSAVDADPPVRPASRLEVAANPTTAAARAAEAAERLWVRREPISNSCPPALAGPPAAVTIREPAERIAESWFITEST